MGKAGSDESEAESSAEGDGGLNSVSETMQMGFKAQGEATREPVGAIAAKSLHEDDRLDALAKNFRPPRTGPTRKKPKRSRRIRSNNARQTRHSSNCKPRA